MASIKKLFIFTMVTSALLAFASLSASAALVGTVSGARVNVRSEASTSSSILDTLDEGTLVDVKAYGEPFITIYYGDKIGYISSDYLSVTTLENYQMTRRVPGVITGNSVRLREAATTESKILAELSLGTTVNILAPGDAWYKVETNGVIGFVSSDYIQASNGTSRGENPHRAEVIKYAKQYLGVPYVYGGSSPKGFDCSGYVYYVLKNFGYSVPHGATSQYNSTAHISRSELQMGDLVFFSSKVGGSSIGHVGIYISDGNFIHASSPGDVVKIDNINSGYYHSHYYGASRYMR